VGVLMSNNSVKKRKPGRPRKVIDYGEVEKLSLIQCTEEEIGNVLEISTRTLIKDKEFLRVYKKGRSEGKKSLRRLQYEKAQGRTATLAKDADGNILKDDKGRAIILEPGYAPDTTMLIWLGKQELGQSDKQELTGKDSGAIEFLVRYRNKTTKSSGNGKVKPQDVEELVSSEKDTCTNQ
jgi:hypothetical protein